ncbi:hypothetical protein HWV62_1244 [Athelia sp. TMB]|nr:hypothetical protein HWV62_1244 [Athelia sp. TMB]
MSSPTNGSPTLEVEPKEYNYTIDTHTVDESYADRRSTDFLSVRPVEIPQQYRVYKRRWLGLFAFVMLNGVATMSWPWFGPISETTAKDFNLSVNQVDWLGNAPMLVFLPFSFLVPVLYAKIGIAKCTWLGCFFLVLSAWVRFLGTIESLPSGAAYAFLMLGQALVAIAQPFFQVLGPTYSETWFDLKSRTTATMLVARTANPVGAALGQLISPIPSSTRTSILVLAILSTAVTPLVLLIKDAPPTPPTYTASRPKNTFASFARALAGRHNPAVDPESAYMTRRERFDFLIVSLTFGIFVGQSSAFGVVTGQIFVPYGYSDAIAGALGSVLLFVGLGASLIAAPIFDRVFTHHLALVSKVLVPITGALWLVFAFAVKANNTGGLFALMALIGAISVPTLPIALELSCELTRNPDGASALLWSLSNVFGMVFIEMENGLEAGEDGNPPENMHLALIVMGAILLGVSLFQVLLQGKQTRRTLDEKMGAQAERADEESVPSTPFVSQGAPPPF